MNMWTRYAIMCCAGLTAALIGAVAWGYHALWARYDKALVQLESRSERLDGLIESAPQIEALLIAVRQNVTPWLHPRGENSQNDVQQKLRELIANSGVTLVSSQAAQEPTGDSNLARIRLTATVTGEWTKLVRLAEGLQSHQPPFWVRTASLNREGSGVGAGAQLARLTLQLDAMMTPEKGAP